MNLNYNKDFTPIFFTIYFVLVIVFTIISRRRTIGPLTVFLLSILLTPVTGLILIILSKRIEIEDPRTRRKVFKCHSCGFEFRYPFDICSVCGKPKVSEKSENSS